MVSSLALIQTAFLGDTALSLLFAQQVRALLPQSSITFVCRPDGESLAKACTSIDRTLVFDKRGKDRSINGMLRLAGQLRRRHVELVFCLQRSIRTTMLALASRASLRVGFSNATGAFLLTHRAPYKPQWHEIERNQSLLEVLGLLPPPITLPLELRLSPEQHARLEQALDNLGMHKPIIAFAPGSVWATKRWLPERYAEVARLLHNEGFTIAFIGGHSDSGLCNELAQRSGTYSLAGMLDPPTTVAFLRICSLLISNDSAPTHFATLAACPTIAIFGSTVPSFGFAPRAPNSLSIEAPPLPCRPCGSHGRRRCPRGTHECMHSITVADVFGPAHEILTRSLQQ